MIITVVVYLCFMLGIGWWCSKKQISGMTDFLIAGRRLGPVLCTAALAATHFGGGALIGGAEKSFDHGVSGAWYGIATGVGLILLGLLTATKFRDLMLYTMPDYLVNRYGGKAIRLMGALLSLVALIGILAAQVKAAQSAFSIIGLEGKSAAVLATAVFITYTALGGLWAAVISDLVQIIIAGVGVVIAGIVVMNVSAAQGGLETLLANRGVEESYFSLVGQGPSFIAWLLLPTVMYTLIGQDFYQRLFAAKTAKVAKRSALIAGVFLIAITLFPTIIGMGARGLGGDTLEGKDAVTWVLQTHINPVLGGVIIAAILAAIMSTADSLLTAATSHIVKDIWIESLYPDSEHDERTLLRLARVATLLVGLCALVIGLISERIVDTLIYAYTMYTAGVFIPVLGGVLWKRATREGAIAAILVGSTIALAGIITGKDIWGIPAEIYAAIGSAISFVFVSLVSKEESRC